MKNKMAMVEAYGQRMCVCRECLSIGPDLLIGRRKDMRRRRRARKNRRGW